MIYISKDGQQSGPYTIEEARALVGNGTFLAYEWAWYEGISEWIPLQKVPGFVPPTVVETEPELPFMAELQSPAAVESLEPSAEPVSEAPMTDAQADLETVAIPDLAGTTNPFAESPGAALEPEAFPAESGASPGASSPKKKSSRASSRRRQVAEVPLPTGPRPGRPVLVWIVCLLFFICIPLSLSALAALPTVFDYVANHQQAEESDYLDAIGKETDPAKREELYAEHRKLSDSELQLGVLRSRGVDYYVLPVAILLVALVAAVFLFRLQKVSLYLFLAASVLTCGAFVLNGLVNGWDLTGGKLLYLSVGTWLVMLGLVFYVWHLGRKGIVN